MGLMYPRIHGLLHGGGTSCDLTTDIFSLYEFENNLNLGFDSVGATTVDLTNVNGVTQAAGIINFSSQADDASLQYFEASFPVSTFDINQSNWTMACWAKINNEIDGRTETIFHVITGSSTQLGIQFILDGTVNGVMNLATGPVMSTAMTDPEVWHHYVLVADGTVGRMYVDGVLSPYFRDVPRTTMSQDGTTVIRLFRGDTVYSNGNIDQMAIWENRSFTQEDVDCLYNSGNGIAI